MSHDSTRPFTTRKNALFATFAAAMLAGLATPAEGGPVDTFVMNLPTNNLAIFGVQYGADYLGPSGGFVLGTSMDLTFTTNGSFDASKLKIHVEAPLPGIPSWDVVGGPDLGWTSGAGTFTAFIETDVLNGEMLDSGGNPLLWYVQLSHVDGLPLGGQFINNSNITVLHSEVPEPATLGLLLISAGLVMRRRTGRK